MVICIPRNRSLSHDLRDITLNNRRIGMPAIKLIALDHNDVPALSAHIQDAVLKVGDLAYEARPKRFAALVNRFDWADADVADTKTSDALSDVPDSTMAPELKRYMRRRAALRFERVLSAQVRGIDLAQTETVLSLLALEFQETVAPSGDLTLHFSGGGSIRLLVECIEGELRDLGPSWRTANRPQHGELETADVAPETFKPHPSTTPDDVGPADARMGADEGSDR